MKKSEIRKVMKKERKIMQEMLVKYLAAKSVSNTQEEVIRPENGESELSPKEFMDVMKRDSAKAMNLDMVERQKNHKWKDYDIKNKLSPIKEEQKRANQERREIKKALKKIKADFKELDGKVDKVCELMAYYMYLSNNTRIGFDLSLKKQYREAKKQAEKKLGLAQKDSSKIIDVKWKEV